MIECRPDDGSFKTALAVPPLSVAVASVAPFSLIVTSPVGELPVTVTEKVGFAVLRIVEAEALQLVVVALLTIVCVTTADVFGALFASPEYAACNECVPTESVLVAYE